MGPIYAILRAVLSRASSAPRLCVARWSTSHCPSLSPCSWWPFGTSQCPSRALNASSSPCLRAQPASRRASDESQATPAATNAASRRVSSAPRLCDARCVASHLPSLSPCSSCLCGTSQCPSRAWNASSSLSLRAHSDPNGSQATPARFWGATAWSSSPDAEAAPSSTRGDARLAAHRKPSGRQRGRRAAVSASRPADGTGARACERAVLASLDGKQRSQSTIASQSDKRERRLERPL
eukprot:scaffold55622_cov67-Phaeocystis_antarctica.AAC.4